MLSYIFGPKIIVAGVGTLAVRRRAGGSWRVVVAVPDQRVAVGVVHASATIVVADGRSGTTTVSIPPGWSVNAIPGTYRVDVTATRHRTAPRRRFWPLVIAALAACSAPSPARSVTVVPGPSQEFVRPVRDNSPRAEIHEPDVLDRGRDPGPRATAPESRSRRPIPRGRARHRIAPPVGRRRAGGVATQHPSRGSDRVVLRSVDPPVRRPRRRVEVAVTPLVGIIWAALATAAAERAGWFMAYDSGLALARNVAPLAASDARTQAVVEVLSRAVAADNRDRARIPHVGILAADHGRILPSTVGTWSRTSHAALRDAGRIMDQISFRPRALSALVDNVERRARASLLVANANIYERTGAVQQLVDAVVAHQRWMVVAEMDAARARVLEYCTGLTYDDREDILDPELDPIEGVLRAFRRCGVNANRAVYDRVRYIDEGRDDVSKWIKSAMRRRHVVMRSRRT